MIYLQFKLNTCCLTLVSNVNLLLVVLLWSRWSKIWLQIRLLEGAITRNLLKSIRRKKIFRCVKHTLALQTQSTTVWEKKKYFGCMDHNSFLKCSLGNASDLYIGLFINVNTAKYRWATNQGKTLTLIWLHLSPRSSSDHLYSPQFTDHEGHWLM